MDKPLWNLVWDADWVTAMAFLGPTRRLAGGNNLGGVLVWELPEKGGPAPLPSLVLEGHTNTVTRLVASADGRWLWSSSNDKTLRLWDMQAKPGEKRAVDLNAVARGRRGGKPPAPLKAECPTLKAAHVLAGHKDWVSCFDLSRDEKTLVSGDDAGHVVVWDAKERKERRRWKLKGWAYAAAISPDGKRVAVTERVPLVFDSGRRHGGKVWDIATGKEVCDFGPAFKEMHFSAADWTPDGKTLLLGRGGECDGQNGIVHLVDPDNGKKVGELPKPGHLNGLTDMRWHPDGKRLATAGRDTVVMLWDVALKKKVGELGKGRGGQFKDWLHALSWSADGKLLAAGDMAGAVQVWAL
ncbi:MAG: hypothetical protein K2W96_26210 [Gemmataceae bacterium]|nr:hypothetical protein [Gemmataceae bacterium]